MRVMITTLETAFVTTLKLNVTLVPNQDVEQMAQRSMCRAQQNNALRLMMIRVHKSLKRSGPR